MIDWINWKLKSWGYAKRRIVYKQEGNPQSIWARIVDEGPGASSHDGVRRDLEVMTGDALEAAMAIHRAIYGKRLTDRQYEVILTHYVVPGMAKNKPQDLGLSSKVYYEILGAGHRNLEPFFGESFTVERLTA